MWKQTVIFLSVLFFAGQVALLGTALAGPPPPPPPVKKGPPAMSDADLNALLGALDQAGFSDEKLALLAEAAQHKKFTVAQVGVVLDHLDDSSDRVEAAVLLYPQIIDPENFYLIYSHFDYDSDKDEVRERLGL